MTEDRSRRGASSTSRPKPSSGSSRSATASSTSGSAGSRTLGAAEIRRLAERHGIRPTKSLGQHFLIDPNVARAAAREAGVGSGDQVIEVGAGLGSLTVALADTGAEVWAIEFDRALLPALEEVAAGDPRIHVIHADAMRLDWEATLGPGTAEWVLCANLPYNIATPLVLDVLHAVPRVRSMLVMIQREVGERLAAAEGTDAYGAISVHVSYHARAAIVRQVPPTVFWPKPAVGSVLLRLDRLPAPPVATEEAALLRLVDEAFAQRRKTMRNALRRLGMDAVDADAALVACGIDPTARPEQLGLEAFARITEAIVA